MSPSFAKSMGERVRPYARPAALALAVSALVVGAVVAIGGVQTITGDLRSVGRGVCAGLGLAVWVTVFLLERRRAARIAIATPLLVGLAMAAVVFEGAASLHGVLTGRAEQGWNVYHYYMGAKYFPELGYGELYSAHLAADEEGGRSDYGFVMKARSMATYRETPRAKLLARFDRRAFFSDARWREFRRDVHAFRPLLPPKKWQGVLIDLGYHPSPAWTLVGTPLANLSRVRGRGWWCITGSDLPFHLLALLALLWAFGPRTTAAAVLWLAAVPLNAGYFAGGFLRHDFLHSSLIAIALWHRGRPAGAGVALAWGAMTRVFPGFLALPILLRAGAALARGGPRAVSPAHRRFLVGLVAACALLFGASHATGRGVSTWPEWLSIISKHAALHPVTSTRRVGVGRLVLHDPRPGDLWATVGGKTLEERVEKRLWARRAVQVVGLALLLLAAYRRTDLDAMLLMTFAVFLLTTLSRYHGTLWVLLFFLGAKGARDPTPWPAAFAGAFLLFVATVFFAIPSMSGQYYALNALVLAVFCTLCAHYLRADRLAYLARPVTERRGS